MPKPAEQPNQSSTPPIPFIILLLWIFGGMAFALIVYAFTPFTHNLDDIKVTFQYSLAPLVFGFFAIAVLSGHARRLHPIILLSVFGFLLFMLLSTLVARFPWRAWHEYGFQLTILTPFLVAAGTCTTFGRFRGIALFYFLIGCGTVYFGLFHFFGGVGALYNWAYAGRQAIYDPLYTLLYTLRQNGDMLSTILNRDFYAAYLLMIVPLGLALAFDAKNTWSELFFLLMFFLMCLCVVLAFSKDSYLALFLMVSAFLVLFCAERNWRVVPARVWATWIVGAVLVFGSLIFLIRDKLFFNLPAKINVSVNSRAVIWGGSLNIFWDATRPAGTFIKYLLLGGGPGAFYLTFPLYRRPDYHLYEISNVTIFSHNQYLDLLSEEGLVGFVLFMTLLVSIAYFLMREAWRKPKHPMNIYQIALFASILGVGFQNIFSPNTRWTVCGFNYWFMLGLSTAAVHLSLDDEQLRWIDRFYDSLPAWGKRAKVALLAFALFFVAASIPYGFVRFNAAKNNNDGLVFLNAEFSPRCDMIAAGHEETRGEKGVVFRKRTYDMGLRTIECFRRALAWKPAFVTSHYKLAHVYSRMAAVMETDPQERERWFRSAKETYDELARYAPDYSEIHLNYGILGTVFFREKPNIQYIVDSLLSFQKAAWTSNKFSVQNYYWRSLEDAARIAATSSPVQAEVVSALESCLRELERRRPVDESFRDRLGRLRDLINTGEIQKAGQLESELFLELALRIVERIPTLFNIEWKEGEDVIDSANMWASRYHLQHGNYEKAIPFLRNVLRKDPANTLYLRWWNTASLQARDPKQCLEFLAELIDLNPLNWAARDAAREMLELVGDYERSLQQALALRAILYNENGSPRINSPEALKLPELMYHTAAGYQKTGQFDAAIAQFNKVIETDPSSVWAKEAQRGITEVYKEIDKK